MANLAIKGHATRGKEVIEILEMLGGVNTYKYSGDNEEICFSIGEFTKIIYYNRINNWINNCYEGGFVFTLEEFLEKYPYKVGDKVNSPCMGCIKTITSMWWDTCLNAVTYKLDNRIYTNIEQLKVFNDLQPYKEENMEEKKINQMSLANCELDEVEIILGDKFELKIKEGKYYAVKKQPKYPKTYEECCEVLQIPKDESYIDIDAPLSYNKTLKVFTQLLICRDAYWKIAGEQMGLGKPWEFENPSRRYVFTIENFGGNIQKNAVTARILNRILVFPTEEMRDAFYENFKDLIEECKEFL